MPKYEYKFRILSCELREVNQKFHIIYLTIKLNKSNPTKSPPKIYLLLIGNDYNPDSHWTRWFGGNIFYLNALLKGAMTLNKEITISTKVPISEFDIPEIDSQYGMYSYIPRPIDASRIESILILNDEDSSNYYTFYWSKPKKSGEQIVTEETKSFPKAPQDIIDNSTPHIKNVLFSREDLTYEQDGLIYGNFSPSFSGACAGGPSYSFIEKAAINSQTRQPNACSTGQYIIKFDLN